MLKRTALLLALTAAVCTAGASTSSHVRHGAAHGGLHRAAAHGGRTAHATVRHEVVRSMDTERATAIQTALIGKGYMSGEPTGTWDATSIAAMQKLQGDNGWQTKITPDSRALIKLGLGPQQQNTASLQ